jgi:hypothetical protein
MGCEAGIAWPHFIVNSAARAMLGAPITSAAAEAAPFTTVRLLMDVMMPLRRPFSIFAAAEFAFSARC